MTIIRRKRTKNFAIVSNSIASDARLSFEARGLLVYVLAKPDDWKVHVKDLMRAGGKKPSGRNNTGRDQVYKILKRLEKLGYVERIERRNPNGTIREFDYDFTDEPVPSSLPFPENKEVDEPLPAKAEVDQPFPALPDVVLPDVENKDTYKEPNLTNTESYKEQTLIKGGFDALWLVWAQGSLPDHKNLSRSLFNDLKTDQERDCAVDFAQPYCERCKRQNTDPHMITYLKSRAWAELNGAPPINNQGLFLITPDREEWEAWMHHILTELGVDAHKSAIEERGILRITRFPPMHKPMGRVA